MGTNQAFVLIGSSALFVSLFVLNVLLTMVIAIPPQFHALHSNRNSGMGGSGSDLWIVEGAKKPSTTTSMPIICLMEWNSPKCREHAFNVPVPKFAPNFKFPTPPPTQNTDSTDTVNYTGFFTPILPKALDPDQQQPERNNRIRHSKTTKSTVASSHSPISTTTNQPSTSPTSTQATLTPLHAGSAFNQARNHQSTTSIPRITTTDTARVTQQTFKRRTVPHSTKVLTTPQPTILIEETNDENSSEDYQDGEGEEEGDEYREQRRQKSLATYAPFARARLVESGPNELDNLWTDLNNEENVEFKSGASWRRPTTTLSHSQQVIITTTPSNRRTTTAAFKTVATSLLATTSHLITTTTERSRQVSSLSTTTQGAAGALFAVRPTTPFPADIVMTTAKLPAATADFPRTALILFASIAVIVIIAVVVFCVFRCRQHGPIHDSSYPMTYNNGKTAGISSMGGAATLGSNHGYLPIPSEMSPSTQYNGQSATLAGHQVCYDSMNGATTLPAVLRRNGAPPNGLNGGMNANGYQPLPTGQVIVNATGQSSPARANGHANGMANGGSRTLGSAVRKKEFKEWYV